MKNILVINSSAADDDAASRQLVRNVVDGLKALEPTAQVVERDVGREPVPHLTAAALGGLRGVPQSAAAQRTRALSDTLLAELRAADVVVIGAPMYNFSVPTTLRAWFDHVLRAGETFSYSESGPRGLLQGKRAIVVESRGGEYLHGPARAIDFQEPYLKHLLGFMGIEDVTFIRAEKMGFGPAARATALAAANAAIATTLPFRHSAAQGVAA
jgi:FMN-dependent NADH-azoreductase